MKDSTKIGRRFGCWGPENSQTHITVSVVIFLRSNRTELQYDILPVDATLEHLSLRLHL